MFICLRWCNQQQVQHRSSKEPLEFNSCVFAFKVKKQKNQKKQIFWKPNEALWCSQYVERSLMLNCRQNKQVVKRHFFRAQLYRTIEWYEWCKTCVWHKCVLRLFFSCSKMKVKTLFANVSGTHLTTLFVVLSLLRLGYF